MRLYVDVLIAIIKLRKVPFNDLRVLFLFIKSNILIYPN